MAATARTRTARTAQVRVERAQTTLRVRYAQARTERDRLAAAGDYVRSLAAAAAETDPDTAATADQVLAGLIRELLDGGDVLARTLTRTTTSSWPARRTP